MNTIPTRSRRPKVTGLPRLPRLPRIGRVEAARRPRFRLTERDREIVLAVYEYRVLTTNQIETLFFAPRLESRKPKSPYNSRCRLRLQALYHAGYLQRDEQPQRMTDGRKPLLYTLDTQGAALVAEVSGTPLAELAWNKAAFRISPFTLEHLLATNDVRVAIQVGACRHNLEVTRWLDDHTLRQRGTTDYVTLKTREGGEQKVALVPDGYFILEDQQVSHHQFLETDMGTTTGMYAKYGRRDYARKVSVYLQYYRSGKYLERYGTRSMRVLTVTTSDRRLANLKAVTEKVGGKGRFWFTTFERVHTADILSDPIWSKAGSHELYSLI